MMTSVDADLTSGRRFEFVCWSESIIYIYWSLPYNKYFYNVVWIQIGEKKLWSVRKLTINWNWQDHVWNISGMFH